MPLLEFQSPAVAAVKKHFRSRESVEWEGRKIHPPIVVNASVSSGKSVMICELAKTMAELALAKEKPASIQVLVIQRQGELCEQNSEAAWSIDLKNSVFSASLGRKFINYNTVYCTEGTIARALDYYRLSPYTPEEMQLDPDQRARLKKFHPDIILIDEGHQVPFDEPDSQYMTVLKHFYDIKPHMRVATFSGSCFRGTDPIVGDSPQHFWRRFASLEPGDIDYPEGAVGNGIISTEFMIEQGWVVPPHFGFPDDDKPHYDFSHLTPKGWDYDEDELDAAVSDREVLLSICQDFIEKAALRKGVLVFAATQRHARQTAAALKVLGVPDEQIGVITDKTKNKDRAAILKKAKTGEIKYTINVAVLTTGINCPWWDTLVFMRPIGSLVLLIQAIGRVLRLLIGPDEVPMIQRSNSFGVTREQRLQMIAESDKPDALVLDYAGVMDTLGHLYENPVLDQADLEKAKKDKLELIECPLCATMNSPHARRCIGKPQERFGIMDRCEHFWHYRECPTCRTKNDQVARECRNQECRRLLIDPNSVLTNKHYSPGEDVPVESMAIESGRGGKLIFTFQLRDGRRPQVVHWPRAGKQIERNTKIWKAFIEKFPIDKATKFRLGNMKAETIVENQELIPVPVELCARENGGRWNLGRLKFLEGGK